ncbi:SIR2 family protein [Mesorhizobium loti]|nr:SIR2 family protein [Mesorhizobium loti]
MNHQDHTFGRIGGRDESVLPLDAFVRSISINTEVGHMLLLGAGASISSRIPSASTCIWQWKRSIFLSNHPGMERNFDELSLGMVQERIQDWLDTQPGFPRAGDAGEYGFYIDRCYPRIEDRRSFFQRHIQGAKLSSGYRIAARLAKNNLFRLAWTTNFDGLIARALAETSVTPVEIGLDSTNRIVRTNRAGELSCVALHGDYRYDTLRNTDAEVQRLDRELRQALIDQSISSPIIVLGYSGRDNSIMEALTDCYSRSGTGVLYWCGFGDGPPPEAVASLIAVARKAGRTAYYVPGAAFDDVMRRLALATLGGADREDVLGIIAKSGTEQPASMPFTVPAGAIGGIVKSTAFKLRCPVEAYSFKPASMPEQGVWRWVREAIGERRDLMAVPYKGRVLALGTLTSIHEVFADPMAEAPIRVPIDISELRHEDGGVTHLLVRSLALAIAGARSLPSEGPLLWDPEKPQRRQVDGRSYKVQDAVLLFIRRAGRDTFLVLKPTVKVLAADGSPAPKEDEKAIKLGILGYQHNDKFDAAVERWRRQLFGEGTQFSCPPSEDSGFVFTIDRAPVSAAIVAAPGEAAIPEKAAAKSVQKGFRIREPNLLFASKGNTGMVNDPHPVRGLVSNRPFDFSLTRSGMAHDIKLGVICPQPEGSATAARLTMLEQAASPSETEKDYLLDFPGFAQAFGLPLVIPRPQDLSWRAPDEPSPDLTKERGTRFAARAVIQAIDELRSAQRVNVILIVTPLRWANWRSFETDNERFDLHDFVKAYCARKGIATQFLDEDTLTDPQTCRIRWWLSLALYAKSFRTPFVLQAAGADTAYVGLGTSIDRHGPHGRKVVLGCSHIFNQQGQGLQYRLSKVENPSFDRRQRNAFLSRDDARRVGESIRQLFFEARSALPRRIIIHKRFEFRRDEREGLLEGLAGIAEVDMVEITVDDAFRYVNSKMYSGKLEVDKFPVARGTVIPIGDQEALLWVHGSAAAIRNNWRYYQGKRRIPAPLRIRRHAGTTDLQTLATEILGLSKMNWNSFDLYTQVPATLETSGQIARIGRLMENFGEANYDYRLLM